MEKIQFTQAGSVQVPVKRIAIVTGASSGLGADFARELARDNSLDELWLVARRKDRLQQLANELNKKCVVLALDLTNPQDLQKLKKTLEKHQPDIRFLINNAGYGALGPAEDIDTEFQLKMIDLNAWALTALTLYSIGYLGRGSIIIQVASSAGFLPLANFAVYAATKAYVISFSRAIGEELKTRGIIVNTVCPGPVKTEFFQASGFADPASAYNSLDVVKHALQRALRGKALSVFGWRILLYRYLYSFIPVWLVLKISKMIKQKK